jgi:hypothetical protein
MLSEWERSSRARNQLGLTLLDGARAVVELVRKPPSRSCGHSVSGKLQELAMPLRYGDLGRLVAIVRGRGTMLFAVTSVVPGEVCEQQSMDFAIVNSNIYHR